MGLDMAKGGSDYILGEDLYHILDTKKSQIYEFCPIAEACTLLVLCSYDHSAKKIKINKFASAFIDYTDIFQLLP